MMSTEAEYYEIRVRGHLNSYWQAWFEGLTLTAGESGETLINGPIQDQAALHGVLAKIRDLGLPLVSVVRVDPGTEWHGAKGENMTANKHNVQISHELPKPNPALKHLDVLVGEWNMELSVPTDPPTILRDLWATFEWLEGRSFLIWRGGPTLPDGQGTIASRLATNPDEPGVIYAANNYGLFRSPDAGQSWKTVEIPWPQHAFAQGVAALICLPD